MKELTTEQKAQRYDEAIAWLEKQGEQKHADKVEPKFKVGDWVVNKYGVVWHIDSFDKKNYQVSNGNEYNYFPISKQDEMHLWTIQDAKDGDVLVCKGDIKNSNGIKYERICLFKNLDNAFFTLTRTSNGIEGYDINVNIDYPDNTVPATKEQKEILFMAMADARYTFDFEKKELRKIEQKQDTIIRINPSEYINDMGGNGCYLKNTVQVSTWSEEDVLAIERIIDTIQCAQSTRNGKPKALYTDEILDNLVNWLKSLRPQNRWKPSEEQMEYLAKAITTLGNEGDNKTSAILYELRTDLKKLKA